MPTPSERLRAILNERLPELTELTFGCLILNTRHNTYGKYMDTDRFDNRIYYFAWKVPINGMTTIDGVCSGVVEDIRIIGHNAPIYDIVRALGEEWGISTDGMILLHAMRKPNTWDDILQLDPSKSAYDQEPAKIEEIIKLFN